MKWAGALSEAPAASTAVAHCLDSLTEALGGTPPDLLLVFASTHHRLKYPHIPGWILDRFPDTVVAGTTAMGVVGKGREVEQLPAIAMLAGRMPGVRIFPWHMDARDIPDQDASPGAWRDWMGLPPEAPFHFLVLADPFEAQVEPFLAGLDFAFPGTAKVGGLASGAGKPKENAFWLNDNLYRSGILTLGLTGALEVETLVAQGCRPIGEPLAVTCCNRNMLLEVDGRPPLTYLRALMPRLSSEERGLVQSSLFLGVVPDPFLSKPAHGDFLVRNLVGADDRSGALATGADLHEGQMVQFQLRDRRTSIEDLKVRLDAYAAGRTGEASPAAALLFSCLGRGEFLYGEKDHDVRMFADRVGDCPVAGFFSNGEIGPVAGSTHIHGYTSVFAMIRAANDGLLPEAGG